jgi:molybdenum cofactor cytidylyltransferase
MISHLSKAFNRSGKIQNTLMSKIPQLLLAAGGSSRMGHPKQLLPWGDKTLIEYQIQIRLQTKQNVIVVLGGYSDEIHPVIEKLPAEVVVNPHWEDGMGTSLAYGIEMVNRMKPEADAVLISLLDQPLVTLHHLETMINAFQPGQNQIIVSESDSGWKGVPALFDNKYFGDLGKLKREEGAKKVILQNPRFVENIYSSYLLEDIDTPEVYHKLLNIFMAMSK